MRRHLSLFVTASRYALIGHARNRFAMLLVVVYIPVWIALAYVTIPDQPAPSGSGRPARCSPRPATTSLRSPVR